MKPTEHHSGHQLQLLELRLSGSGVGVLLPSPALAEEHEAEDAGHWHRHEEHGEDEHGAGEERPRVTGRCRFVSCRAAACSLGFCRLELPRSVGVREPPSSGGVTGCAGVGVGVVGAAALSQSHLPWMLDSRSCSLERRRTTSSLCTSRLSLAATASRYRRVAVSCRMLQWWRVSAAARGEAGKSWMRPVVGWYLREMATGP